MDITVNTGTFVGSAIPSPCDNASPSDGTTPSDLAITTTCPLSDAQVGVAYEFDLVASGGVAPYFWSISAGALPAGLTLSTDGMISGTPTGAEVASFTIEATGTIGGSITKSCQITVVLLSITTSCPLADANTIVAYDQTLVGAGGATPYTWAISSGSLPTGLSLNSATGEITGTPSGTGVSAFTIRLTDHNGLITTKSCQITVITANALILTDDFNRTDTGFGSNNLSTPKWTVLPRAPGDVNKTQVCISHDSGVQALHFQYENGSTGRGIAIVSVIDYFFPGTHALMEDSDQLAEGACVLDPSSSGSAFCRSGPMVLMSGNWNASSIAGYFIDFKKYKGAAGVAQIGRFNAGDDWTNLGAEVPATLHDVQTITAKVSGSSVRIRLFINSVMLVEYTDSTANRLTTGMPGWNGPFCSSGLLK